MVNAMHGRCIVSNYGSGYQPVCDRVIAELQSENCSYFSFLKSLLSVLEHAVESTERAQSIVGQSGRVGCGIDAQCLATAQVKLTGVLEAVVAVIQNAAASEDKEEISRNFLKQTCNELIRECFDALYHISNSRRRLSIFAEHYTDAFSSVSNTVLVVVDAITLMRRAHTYVTTGNTVESSAIIDARRRIARCMNAACYAIHAVPSSTIRSSVAALGGGCSAPEIREMTCYLLQEAVLLSSLIHSGEETENHEDEAYLYCPSQYALDLLRRVLTRLIHRLAPSCPNTRFFTEVFHAAMDNTSAEYLDMGGRITNDDAVIHQRNLSSMLLEAVAMTHMVNASCAARAQKAKEPDHCADNITFEKVQKAFSTIQESERLCVDQSLGDANVFFFIIGLVADAQLLLESIDVNSLPNPPLHGELLHRTREILIDAGSLFIRLQCATEPEYRPTQALMQQRNLSDILSDTVYALQVAHISIRSPVIGEIVEKLQEVLSALRGRNITEATSLGDANALSCITGTVADAQLLLESIDVHSLPNPALHGELLNNVRKRLCEAASICIGLQCAGNPEYMTPQESDFDPGVGEGNPSTYLAALSTLMSAFSLHSRRQ
ncbi:hypothetical protein P029_03160 [Anaplasma phagocytophilum str. Norway variant2]|uniref:HGE-14 protein n=2 Tax=Anaplasma phagocytophilum TaxID=948 RepID=A0A168HCQ6_ANAPH|nr:hypothetical protein P029_03160 [Anaplasma phagocytophilum str. Norway variant2]